MTTLDNFATVKEVASRLDVHPESVRRLIRQGKIPAVKVFNRRWLVERHILEQYAAHYDPRKGYGFEGYLFEVAE